MRFFRGLQAQILLRTILPLILTLVAVSFGSITLHQRAMRTMVAERDAHLAALAASRFDESIRMRVLLLEMIVDGATPAADASDAPDSLEPVARLFDQGVAVFSAAGILSKETIPGFGGLAGEVGQVLEAARESPGSAVYRLVPAVTGSPLLFVAWADGRSGRVAVGAMSERGLNVAELLVLSSRIPRVVAYLVAEDGRVIYHRDQGEIGKVRLMHSGVSEALRGEAGTTFEELPGEDEHVVGYAPIRSTGWALIVEEPWADVIAPGLQYTLWAPILVLLAAVASLGALHFGVRRVIRPLQSLRTAASRLAWGDFEAIATPAGGIDEIANLQITLQEMAAQIQRSQAGMQDYIASLTLAQEDERRRVARELHDETVQGLIALGQRVKILELDWQADCEGGQSARRGGVTARLAELSMLIAKSLKDLRGLIHDLRPLYLEELGLVAALKMLVEGTNHGGVRASLEVAGAERRLAAEAELATYRIAQASVTNALRHGSPKNVALRLEFDERGILLTVEDDGSGFDPPERPNDLALEGHFGLVGMYERASRLGGHLSIRSAPDQGTKIAAFLPHENSEQFASARA